MRPGGIIPCIPMTDWINDLTRRRFLGNLAILGAAPLWTRLDALAWQGTAKTFSGDNLELAHKLLFDPSATIKAGGAPEIHQDLQDVLIIGGGIAGLTVAWKLRDRKVRLLEAAPEVGGVSKSENW